VTKGGTGAPRAIAAQIAKCTSGAAMIGKTTRTVEEHMGGGR